MAATDEFVLRRADFSLSEEQELLQATFRTFFGKQCPTERVRAAEPLGWDPELWAQLQELRPAAMGLAADRGGDDAGLVELAIVAEEAGRHAAPVPLVETMAVARLLARVDGDAARDALDRIVAGNVATIALARAAPGPQLVPAGAVAPIVIGVRGDALVLLVDAERPHAVQNLASAPMAWIDLADGVELLTGAPARECFGAAQDEWRVLTAAALVGLGDAALRLGVQHAKDRTAFGAPIGSFQAIAHPLVDVAIALEGARRLVHRTAWFADHEPDALGVGPSIAFVQAAEAAEQAGAVAIHTQGGFGFTLESDVQLFFRRAKGWSLVLGDRRAELRRIGAHRAGSGAGLAHDGESDAGGRA